MWVGDFKFDKGTYIFYSAAGADSTIKCNALFFKFVLEKVISSLKRNLKRPEMKDAKHGSIVFNEGLVCLGPNINKDIRIENETRAKLYFLEEDNVGVSANYTNSVIALMALVRILLSRA